MSVEEILGTHRRPLIADAATLAACIDECVACAATCTICADACLAEPDIEALVRCIRLCLDCADACVDAGRILSRQTDPDAPTQRTALEACKVLAVNLRGHSKDEPERATTRSSSSTPPSRVVKHCAGPIVVLDRLLDGGAIEDRERVGSWRGAGRHGQGTMSRERNQDG